VTDPQPACASCIQSTCCNEAEACAGDGTCAACLKDPTGDCATYPLFKSLTACKATCGSCAGGPSGGGSSGCNAGGTPSRATSLGPLAALAILLARRRRRGTPLS
jgi:hypothetical protein